MKLIDRDKFISDMFDLYIENRWSPRDIHFSLLDVRNNIDFKGYEVKAIPIEWIKNIINTNIYLWEQNKERMFVDQGVVKVVNYSMTAQILSELIDRWEKENADKT